MIQIQNILNTVRLNGKMNIECHVSIYNVDGNVVVQDTVQFVGENEARVLNRLWELIDSGALLYKEAYELHQLIQFYGSEEFASGIDCEQNSIQEGF